MKPLHIGLLVVGAALAGGLALKLAEPVPIPLAGPVAQPVNPVVRHTVVSAPPVAVSVPAVKPSPMPHAPKRASAPSPVYEEPAKPAIRKNKPILIARLTAAAKPSPWRPSPYHAAAQPSTPPAVVEQKAEQSAEPALLPAVEPTPVVEKIPPPPPRQVTLRPGIAIPVRLDESLSSDKNLGGDTFQASLAEPLVVDGLVIAEKGARVSGRVVDSQKARITGIAILQLGLASVTTSDGQQVAISTDPWMRNGDTSRPAADAGTIPGGVAARVPQETVIRFRLASRVTITEQQVANR
jgi:hypothetical protein